MEKQLLKSKIFTKLLEQAEKNKTLKERTSQSLNWYRQKISSLYGNVEIESDLKSDITDYYELKSNLFIFKYEPKHKETLKYYDEFPLVLVLEESDKGFLGLNFHYLDRILRSRFMNNLYKFERYSDANKQLVINITYDQMKYSGALRYFRPCIKRYLTYHVKSPFYRLHPSEWDMALFLPIERFVKASKGAVWSDSKRLI